MLIKRTRRERKNERKAYSCKIKSCCCSVDKLISKFKWTSLDSEESGSRTPPLDTSKGKMRVGGGEEYKDV